MIYYDLLSIYIIYYLFTVKLDIRKKNIKNYKYKLKTKLKKKQSLSNNKQFFQFITLLPYYYYLYVNYCLSNLLINFNFLN